MKKFRILALLLVIMMMGAVAVAETADDPVIIKVDDQTVVLSEVQAFYDYYYSQYMQLYAENAWQLTAKDLEDLRDDIIYEFVRTAVMNKKITELGFDEITDEDKENLRNEIEANFEADLETYSLSIGLSVEEARELVAAEGITAEAVYEANLPNLPYARLQDYSAEDVTVSDEDVQAAYDEEYVPADKEAYGSDAASYEMNTLFYGQTDVFYIPDGYRYTKHILLAIPDDLAAELNDIKTDRDSTQNLLSALNTELYALENVDESTEEDSTQRTEEEIQADIAERQATLDELNAKYEEAREKILPSLQPTVDEIMGKLDGGASFDELIAEYNTDPGMTTNQDGYLVHLDSIAWDTAFRDGAMGLDKVGDVSEPVISEYGVHIIQYAGDAGGPVPLSEETAATIRDSLLTERKEEAFQAAYEEWLADCEVETHPELLKIPEAPAATEEGASEEVPADESTAEGENEDGSVG